MNSLLKKSIGLILFVLGLAASAFSLLVVAILATEPAIPLALTLVVAVITCGISFTATYAGWRLWKGRKQPDRQIPGAQTVELAAGSPPPEPTVKPSGSTKTIGGTGAGVAPAKPATMECPGCGAPVKAASSEPVECEYCGNQIHVTG